MNRLLLTEDPFFSLSTNGSLGPAGEGCCRWREQPFDVHTRRLFGAVRQELLTRRVEYRMYELPQLHQAIADCFTDWRLLAEGGGPAVTTALWTPETTRILVAPARWLDCPLEVTRFYRLPDGARRVLAIEEWGDGFRIALVGPRCQAERMAAELDRLSQRMKRPHYLAGQILKAGSGVLEGFEPRTWDDVALAPDVRAAIERNTVEIFRRREAFRRNGVPLKRGIILHGPPGTGKTLVAKVLAGLNLGTFVYVTAADMDDADAVRATFDLARKLEPSIVFFEDIDIFADQRSSYCSKAILGEILAQLDGLETNDGLVFIATTNDLEAIDPAIRERPSRFDMVLHLDLPSLEARRRILAQNLPSASVADALLNEAALATDGLSGAQLREVGFLALQAAILRDSTDAAGRARLERNDVTEAVARLTGLREVGIGFGKRV